VSHFISTIIIVVIIIIIVIIFAVPLTLTISLTQNGVFTTEKITTLTRVSVNPN